MSSRGRSEIAGRRIRFHRETRKLPKGRHYARFERHLIMPGLITRTITWSSTLSTTGRGPYKNAGAWARDIYRPDESPVREPASDSQKTRDCLGRSSRICLAASDRLPYNPPEASVFDRNFPVEW